MDILEILSILAGLSLLGFALFDIFMTVLVIGGGAGVQSGFVADRIWRFALRLHDYNSDRSHSLLRAVGPSVVLLALVIWVLELCLGWALIFVARAFEQPEAVTFLDRLVFAGKAIIGRSGNTPELTTLDGGWEIVNSIAGTSGVVIVSVGLAYVLPILGAVAHSRSVAALISTLGNTPEDLRELMEDCREDQFQLHLVSLVAAISLTAERHRSYPVLHYFHSKDPHASLAPAITKIAIFLQRDRQGAKMVDPAVARPLNRAILNLLEALGRMGLTRYARDDEEIDENAMSEIIIDPLASPPNDGEPSEGWLKAYVKYDGWSWEKFFDTEGDRTA